jgi:hypothetical protein
MKNHAFSCCSPCCLYSKSCFLKHLPVIDIGRVAKHCKSRQFYVQVYLTLDLVSSKNNNIARISCIAHTLMRPQQAAVLVCCGGQCCPTINTRCFAACIFICVLPLSVPCALAALLDGLPADVTRHISSLRYLLGHFGRVLASDHRFLVFNLVVDDVLEHVVHGITLGRAALALRRHNEGLVHVEVLATVILCCHLGWRQGFEKLGILFGKDCTRGAGDSPSIQESCGT